MSWRFSTKLELGARKSRLCRSSTLPTTVTGVRVWTGALVEDWTDAAGPVWTGAGAEAWGGVVVVVRAGVEAAGCVEGVALAEVVAEGWVCVVVVARAGVGVEVWTV